MSASGKKLGHGYAWLLAVAALLVCSVPSHAQKSGQPAAFALIYDYKLPAPLASH